MDSYKTKDFSVYMIQTITNDIMFCHPTDNAEMLISKDGTTIKLSPNEIKDVVKAAGGNFRR